MEEYQKRRISLDDFLDGQPSIKMTFSKFVRKFNRELLKATCQVIGCKPIYAHQIAEGVFDELNYVLNNLSEQINFEEHFDIQLRAGEGTEGFSDGLSQNCSKQYRQITTITTSAPLFKCILSKHLDKYKYSRPEYLKDFYIASDLVCKNKLNDIFQNPKGASWFFWPAPQELAKVHQPLSWEAGLEFRQSYLLTQSDT